MPARSPSSDASPVVVTQHPQDIWTFHCEAESDKDAVPTCLRVVSQHFELKTPLPEVDKHQHLRDHPELKVSISHTRGMAIVSVTQSESIAALGCDIEYATRKISARAVSHFTNALDDHAKNDGPIILWTLKEAAFKALYPWREYWQAPNLFLSNFWVRDGRFGLVESPGSPIGHTRCNLMHSRSDEPIILALAHIDAAAFQATWQPSE